jgi:hypothetical protein
MNPEGITEVVAMGIDTSPETKLFLGLLERFCADHGYRNPVGVLIVPLMRDGFGVMGAGKNGLVIDQERAFEYLIDIGRQLDDWRQER